MKLKYFIYSTLLVGLLSCNKENSVDPLPTKPTNTFGVLVNDADGVNFSISQKVTFVKDVFKVPYTRVSIAIPNWTGTSAIFEAFNNAGIKVFLNVSSKVTNETTPPGPFITDLVLYRTKLIEILDKYKPEVLVVENEETNEQYYTSPPQDYINILTIAIDEGHKRNIKVTNGGIPLRTSTLLCWDNYQSTGQTAAAANYALRAFPSSISANMPAFMASNVQAQQMLSKAKTLMNAYKTLQLDFVNFHWYELVTQREIAAQTSDLPTLAHVDMKAFEETYNYYKSFTGKQPITNEIGQINKVGSLLTDIVTKCYDLKIPYVIWYSGDGGAGKATALYDGSGTLRDNGNAFKTFISSKY
ncbi:MAG: hypothetical protein JSR97_01335 [Verrucomicrobia bacterium]|nr:hypothetical protein [Verrucomicrobiota bacterium]